jgi:hypothetical protein
MTVHLAQAGVGARDYVGYGESPPRVSWPGGERVAISVVLNIEEGAERSVARGDAADDLNGHWGVHSVHPDRRNRDQATSTTTSAQRLPERQVVIRSNTVDRDQSRAERRQSWIDRRQAQTDRASTRESRRESHRRNRDD